MARNTDDKIIESISRAKYALNFSLQTVNPWEHDSKQITSIRNSLILAERMGLKTMKDNSKCTDALAQLPSSKLIALQKELSGKKDTFHQVKQNIARHFKEKETANILHLDVIDKRITMVKQLCTDLDSVLQNADVLIHRLQKPFVGEYLKMNAAYHRYACEVFAKLAPTLNDLSVHLDNMTWLANNDFSPSQLDPMLVEVQSLTASLQTSYHTLCQMRKGIEGLSHNKVNSTDLETSFYTDTTMQSSNSTKSAATLSSSNTLTKTRNSRTGSDSGRVT